MNIYIYIYITFFFELLTFTIRDLRLESNRSRRDLPNDAKKCQTFHTHMGK